VGVGDRNDRGLFHLYGFFKDKIGGATGFGVVEGVEGSHLWKDTLGSRKAGKKRILAVGGRYKF
jgi:hypothetical protein